MANSFVSYGNQRLMSNMSGYDDGIIYPDSSGEKLIVTSPRTEELVYTVERTELMSQSMTSMTSSKEDLMSAIDFAGESDYFTNSTNKELDNAIEKLSFAEKSITNDNGVATKSLANAKEVITKAHTKASKVENSLPAVDDLTTSVTNLKSTVTVICEETTKAKKEITNAPDYITNLKSFYSKNDDALAQAYTHLKNADDLKTLDHFTTAKNKVAQAYTDVAPKDAYTALVELKTAITNTDNFITLAITNLKDTPDTLHTLQSYTDRSLDTFSNTLKSFRNADDYVRNKSLADLTSTENYFVSTKNLANNTQLDTFTNKELDDITNAVTELNKSVNTTDTSMMYAEKYATDVPPLANETKNSNLNSITTLNSTLDHITNAKEAVTDKTVLNTFTNSLDSLTNAETKTLKFKNSIYSTDELDYAVNSVTDKPLSNAIEELDKADRYITSLPDDASDDLVRLNLGMVLNSITTAEGYLQNGEFITNAKDSVYNLRNKITDFDWNIFADDDATLVMSAGDYVEDLCKSVNTIASYTTEYAITAKTYATKTREALEAILSYLTSAERYVSSGQATALSSIISANNATANAVSKAETITDIDVTEAYTAVTVAVANASGVCEAIEKAYIAVKQVTIHATQSRTYAEKIISILETTLKRVELIETVFFSNASTTLTEYLEKAETSIRKTVSFISTVDEATFSTEQLKTIQTGIETVRTNLNSVQDSITDLCSDDTEIDIDELKSDSLTLKDALKQLVDFITTVASNLLYVEENIKKPSESITNAKTSALSAHDKSVKASQNTFEETELDDLISTIGNAKDSVTTANDAVEDAVEHLANAKSYSDKQLDSITNAKSSMSNSYASICNADDILQSDAGITYYSITSVPSDTDIDIDFSTPVNAINAVDDVASDTSEYTKLVWTIPKEETAGLFEKLNAQNSMTSDSFTSATTTTTTTYSSFTSSQSYTEQAYTSMTSAKESFASNAEYTKQVTNATDEAVANLSFAGEIVEDEETEKTITKAKESAETTKKKAAETSTDVGETEEVTDYTTEIDEWIDLLCTEIESAQDNITNITDYSGSSSDTHIYLLNVTNSLNTALTHITTAKSYIASIVTTLSEKISTLKSTLTVCKKKTDIVYSSIVSKTEVTTTITTVETAREYVLTMCEGLSSAKKSLEKAQDNASKASKAKSDGLEQLKNASDNMKKADSALRNESGTPLYDFNLAKNAVTELQQLAKKTLAPTYTDQDMLNTLMAVSRAETAMLFAKENTYTITRKSDEHVFHMLIDENGNYNIIENNAAKLVYNLDTALGTLTDTNGNIIEKFSAEEPGPGSDQLDFLGAYTYCQFVGLNDDLADLCTNITRVDKPSLPDAPPSSGNHALYFKNQDFECLVLKYGDLYHLFKNNTYNLTYQLRKNSAGEYVLDEQHWQKINGTWKNISSNEGKYKLTKATRSDGKLSYWNITKPGSNTPIAALTPPMKLSERYEDCEERTKQLYGKNNNKTSTIANAKGTTFTSTPVVSNTAKKTTTTDIATTTKTNTQQSKATKWSWSTASVTLASMGSNSTSSLKNLLLSDTKPTTTWSWAKDITISNYLSGSGNSNSSSDKKTEKSVTDTIVEKGKQALGAVSNILDKIVAFFTKDTETSQGENLKKEEPLTVPDTSKETKALASSISSLPPQAQDGVREGVVYSASLERQKVAYGKGRQSYQAEHHKANNVRKRRARYKAKKMCHIISVGSGHRELSEITNSNNSNVNVDFSSTV